MDETQNQIIVDHILANGMGLNDGSIDCRPKTLLRRSEAKDSEIYFVPPPEVESG